MYGDTVKFGAKRGGAGGNKACTRCGSSGASAIGTTSVEQAVKATSSADGVEEAVGDQKQFEKGARGCTPMLL